jgi:hypothetical protein
MIIELNVLSVSGEVWFDLLEGETSLIIHTLRHAVYEISRLTSLFIHKLEYTDTWAKSTCKSFHCDVLCSGVSTVLSLKSIRSF